MKWGTFQDQKLILLGDNPGFFQTVVDDLTTEASFNSCPTVFQCMGENKLPHWAVSPRFQRFLRLYDVGIKGMDDHRVSSGCWLPPTHHLSWDPIRLCEVWELRWHTISFVLSISISSGLYKIFINIHFMLGSITSYSCAVICSTAGNILKRDHVSVTKRDRHLLSTLAHLGI